MDLWIRTQSRKQLIKCENIYIDNIGYTSQTYYINADSIRLGEYKTKERALEVLDEIQKLLQPQTIINYESKLEFHPEYTAQNIVKTIPKTEIKELSTYVYEMPEE